MRAGEPSRTAFGAAMLRALHQEEPEPRIFTDPLARRILGDPDETAGDADEWRGSRLQTFIAVRHRFAEDSLAAAVARGTRQVVVLGAGLDTFAYRNPYDVRVFEVDHPSTGAWKWERLADAGIPVPDSMTQVGVDFEHDRLLDRLVEHGLDTAAPAFFCWLGVVPYLSRDAVAATLAAIASVPGGEVVLDHTSPTERLAEVVRQDRARLEARVADLGEPLTTAWEPDDLHALLDSLGFTEVEDLGRAEIRERYLGLPAGEPRRGGGHVVRARVG